MTRTHEHDRAWRAHPAGAGPAQAIRQPAVAGAFYPDQPATLSSDVHTCMRRAAGDAADKLPVALIAPHAGLQFSGQVAAAAYQQLKPYMHKLRRIVIVGPSHRVAFSGLAVPSHSTFRTPLGDVPVDLEAVDQLLELPQVNVIDKAHAEEHSLEVQLPFLQTLADDPPAIVPLVVGDASTDQVAQAIDIFWRQPGNLTLISSDLSHFHALDEARRIDASTADAIEARRLEDIGPQQACGALAIRAVLALAQRDDLPVTRLDLATSADAGGPPSRVVGYGAFRIG